MKLLRKVLTYTKFEFHFLFALRDCSFNLFWLHENPKLLQGFNGILVVSKLFHVLSKENWLKMILLNRNLLIPFEKLVSVVAKIPQYFDLSVSGKSSCQQTRVVCDIRPTSLVGLRHYSEIVINR